MCLEALGVVLSVAKHLKTVLTSFDSIWDNLKKIEKMKFFASKFSKSLTVLSFASGNFFTGHKKQHEDNVIGHKTIFESKLNEIENRIKNHEDLRSLKINQSSRDLNRFLEKTDKRLGQIEQLINTGEEVIKELILKIDELTKKRKASSSSIQFSDKKIPQIQENYNQICKMCHN